MYKIYLGFIFCFCISCVAQAQENGFDKICKIYSTVLTKNMDAQFGSKYINSNIKLYVHDKNAIQAHNEIFLVSQAQRYQLFKKIAEHTLKRHWNCSAMKTLLNHPPH